MAIIAHLARWDLHRPVRQAAAIMTCSKTRSIPVELEKERLALLRSHHEANWWAACHVFITAGRFDLEVVKEIFAQLFDIKSSNEAKQAQLVELMSKIPKDTPLFLDELCSRLNSASASQRSLASIQPPR
ncbi:hypothetical protein RvY_03016-2 [Ramazzottius varieornatus]|nr:hypothetical protein RvY_03016-2 [Ramazzottius varieornatus]